METPLAAIHRSSTDFHPARARPRRRALVYGMTAPSSRAREHRCSSGSSAPPVPGPSRASCGHWERAMKPRKLRDCLWGTGKKEKKKRGDGGWRFGESPAWVLLGSRFSGTVDPGCAGNRGEHLLMLYFILPHVHRGPPQTINRTTSDCILAAEDHIILPPHGPRRGPGGGESILLSAFPLREELAICYWPELPCVLPFFPEEVPAHWCTFVHMNVNSAGAMFTEIQQKSLHSPWQISDPTLWMGNREHRSTRSAASPVSGMEWGGREKKKQKKPKSFLIMFTRSLQTT